MSTKIRADASLRALVLPDVGVAFARFPVPVLCSVAVTVVAILIAYGYSPLDDVQDRLVVALITAGLAALALDLFGKGREWGAPMRVLASAAGALAIGLLHAAGALWRPEGVVLMPGLVLAVGVAGYARRGVSLDAFWQFNQRLWLSAGIAVLGAALFALGIVAIDRSLDILFGINFETLVWRIALPISFCLLAPLYFLSSVPLLEPEEGFPPDDFVERTTRRIARFVLVPLLAVYTLILLAYALRILVSWELPQGQIGYMVSAFGTVGAATVLALHPERREAGFPVSTFLRWWFAATLVPVVLLFVAAFQRIAQYGLTDGRYMLLMVATWLGVLAVLFAWPRRERDIRVIPGLLALLLIAASFGPWGAVGLSVRSQTARLADLLQQSGLMVDGRLDGAAVSALPPGDGTYAQIRSVLTYLDGHDALGRTAGLAGAEEGLPADLRVAFALGPRGGDMAVAQQATLPDVPTSLDLEGFGRLLGPIQLADAGVSPPTLDGIVFAVEGGVLRVVGPAGLSEIALADFAGARPDTMRRSVVSSDGRVQLVMLYGYGERLGERFEIRNATFFVALRDPD